ncbi:hypothetical protein J8J14_10340 [Roseomonas sp. SSH11]|uniref:Uncharacterized protein n=1 Tax=Pararoseomonas baculiformis TaxID=2820812 RepID=A0ABS4AF97_9PROT|nr:hypothetical protein [Pararoseomonas baculiformis]MBP0445178.1 hypothetical protein [Pararoseomonas baculiformis]
MSRKFALLAAAFAFTAFMGAGSVAHAQAQSDMIPPGASLPGGSTQRGAVENSSVMPNGRTAYSGSSTRSGARMGQHHRMHSGRHATRGERRAMRRDMRQQRRASASSESVYMGGGGVFERMPDGSLRAVQ